MKGATWLVPEAELSKFFFFFLAASGAYRSIQARDQTRATAVTTWDPQLKEPPGNSQSSFLLFGCKPLFN